MKLLSRKLQWTETAKLRREREKWEGEDDEEEETGMEDEGGGDVQHIGTSNEDDAPVPEWYTVWASSAKCLGVDRDPCGRSGSVVKNDNDEQTETK